MLNRVTQNPSPQLGTTNLEGINHNQTKMIALAIEEIVQTARTETETAKKPNEQPVSKEQVQAVVESLNQFLQPSQTSLNFEYHEQANKYTVQVVDQTTNETIMEIPSKQIMDAYANMLEYIGIMVDKKI